MCPRSLTLVKQICSSRNTWLVHVRRDKRAGRRWGTYYVAAVDRRTTEITTSAQSGKREPEPCGHHFLRTRNVKGWLGFTSTGTPEGNRFFPKTNPTWPNSCPGASLHQTQGLQTVPLGYPLSSDTLRELQLILSIFKDSNLTLLGPAKPTAFNITSEMERPSPGL